MLKPGSLPAALPGLAKTPSTKGRPYLIALAVILVLGLAAAWMWAASRQGRTGSGAEAVPADKLAVSLPFTASQTTRETLPGRSTGSLLVNGQPAAELPLTYYDFGRIAGSMPVSQSFSLWNRGDAPLVIEKAYTTCACTRAEISSVEIPPGMASQITIQFDPGVHNVAGMTVRRGLVLALNDPAAPSLEIWIQASVEK